MRHAGDLDGDGLNEVVIPNLFATDTDQVMIIVAEHSPQAVCQGVADAAIVSLPRINAIPQAQIDFLKAQGESLQASDVTPNIFNDLLNERVCFRAVIMSDPLKSGLASYNADQGRVGRTGGPGR